MPFVEFSEDDLSWSGEKRTTVLDEIRSVREYSKRLNRWQRDFLDSIEGQLADRGFLTSAQLSVLGGLLDKLG